jgi:hypothetical protein
MRGCDGSFRVWIDRGQRGRWVGVWFARAADRVLLGLLELHHGHVYDFRGHVRGGSRVPDDRSLRWQMHHQKWHH